MGSVHHLNHKLMLAIAKDLGLDALATDMKKKEEPPPGDQIELDVGSEQLPDLTLELDYDCVDEVFAD